MPKIYAWEKCYRAVLDETDPAKIPERLLIAERTILNRVLELKNVSTRLAVNELAWLQKATERLAAIQAVALLRIERAKVRGA
jgi:hypothetical protein